MFFQRTRKERMRFRNNVLLLLLILLLIGTNCEFNNRVRIDASGLIDQDPIVLVIKHRQDTLSTALTNHVTIAMQYAKFPVETIDLGLISEGLDIKPSVRTIVVASELISQLSPPEIERLITFVANGNNIVFLGAVFYDDFSFLQGILPFTDFSVDSTAKGVYLHKNIFPQHAGKTYYAPAELPHKGLAADQFKSDVEIAAAAGNDPEYPLVIINKVGLGEVVTINSNLLYEKLYRGLIFSTILKGLDGIPYSVANVATIFLDDFPAPLYNEKLPPIDQEYDVTHSEFVANIWWPDMKAFADTFDISYSAMTAFNYNANVTPPFDFDEWTAGKTFVNGRQVDASSFVARNILESRHELAFHGYNHFSLWLEDWDNVNFMASSVYAARKRWRIDRMGDLPITYVPPTNYIDSTGISAIMKGMPSIRYMSSLYLGELELGTGREFGYEPYAPDDRLFDYPRISSGFSMNENSLFEQQGMQLLTGIWTHFIHPDDVFQVSQREEDEFRSRNPLKLGWKTHPVYGYGLYHVFRDRVLFTNERYPTLRYLAGNEAGAITEDWQNSFVLHKENQYNRTFIPLLNPGYESKSNQEEHYWFAYVSEANAEEFEEELAHNNVDFSISKLWDGALYQFSTKQDSLVVPNFDPKYRYDNQFKTAQVNDVIVRSRQYQTEFTDEFGNLITNPELLSEDWVDTRLEDAIRAYNNNPDNIRNQENLITLSIEFSEIRRAILILERRLLSSPKWAQNDLERLFTYYGWEGLTNQAENFLERLWLRYRSQEVIDVKDFAVQQLDLYSEEFNLRWALREKELNPNNEAIVLQYTRLIENQENWPIIKPELLRLIQLNPDTDSLYAYTIQRSFFYDSSETTIELLEGFPASVHPQLDPFATNFAFIYGYDLNNYPRALYWANRAEGFSESIKLNWLAQLNLYSEYQQKAIRLLEDNPENDSLRVQIGTELYYEGFVEEGREVLYPLFLKNPKGNSTGHQLINNEMQYFSYEERKSLYSKYPAFFSDKEKARLKDEMRWTEGVRLSAFGEYRDDNFDNRFARFGLSTQFGNRNQQTHLFKLEDLFFENSGSTQLSNYAGLGYEFSTRYAEQANEFKVGGGVFSGSGDFLTELFTSLSHSGAKSFTSGKLSFGPELTNQSVINNFNKFRFEGYREDNWSEKWVTSLSGAGTYYTNSVTEYEATGRFHYQITTEKLRARPIASLSWSDASENFNSGIPYFTPDQYFEQGLGVDFRYRKPDTFDFFTKLELELMARHEFSEGIFGTGRLQLDHKFKQYWELRLGTEISTSKIYSSNRLFFTLSYYFRKKLPKVTR